MQKGFLWNGAYKTLFSMVKKFTNYIKYFLGNYCILLVHRGSVLIVKSGGLWLGITKLQSQMYWQACLIDQSCIIWCSKRWRNHIKTHILNLYFKAHKIKILLHAFKFKCLKESKRKLNLKVYECYKNN